MTSDIFVQRLSRNWHFNPLKEVIQRKADVMHNTTRCLVNPDQEGWIVFNVHPQLLPFLIFLREGYLEKQLIDLK